MLELRDLVKVYGGHQVVNQVSLKIHEGEFFSLLGPSGCGKTTLLRILGGFESLTSGQIFLDGKRMDLLPPHQRNFNMVFQRYALFPHLNVLENVAFGLRMKKVPEPEIRSRVEESLALVRMETFATRAVTTLSGGQQQRVALVRALVNRPKVLLLDEPLSALDLKLRQEMQVELRSIQKRLKITFIFVTHDQEEALSLSDRIAIMNAGNVEQVGTPREIYERPGSEFVAGFIGSINTIEGVIRNASQGIQVVSSDGATYSVLSTGRESSLFEGTQVKLMVRPERMQLVKSISSSNGSSKNWIPGKNWIQGKVKEVIYQGPLTRFLVLGSQGSLISVIQSNFFQSAHESFAEGEEVFAIWAPEEGVVMPTGVNKGAENAGPQ